MGLKEALAKPFGILKRNPKIIFPYLLFTALIGGIVLAYVLSSVGPLHAGFSALPGGYSSALNGTLLALEAIAPAVAMTVIASLFIAPLLTGMYVHIVDQGYNSRKVSLKKAFNAAKTRYLPMFAVSILMGAAWVALLAVLALIFVTPVMLAGMNTITLLWLLVGALVTVIASVFLSMGFYETFVVVILENKGTISAIKRSIDIAKRKPTPVFGIIVVTFLASIVFSVIDSIAISIVQIPLELNVSLPLGIGLGQLINFILAAVFSSWVVMIPTAFYKEYVMKSRNSKKTTKRRTKRRRR